MFETRREGFSCTADSLVATEGVQGSIRETQRHACYHEVPTHSSLGRGPEAWQGICGEPSLARGAPQHTADTSPPALPGARLNSTGQTGPEGVVPPAMPTSCSSAYASRTPAGAIPPTKRCTHHRTLDSQWSVLKRSGTSAVGLYGPPMRRVILTPEVAFTSCPRLPSSIR